MTMAANHSSIRDCDIDRTNKKNAASTLGMPPAFVLIVAHVMGGIFSSDSPSPQSRQRWAIKANRPICSFLFVNVVGKITAVPAGVKLLLYWT